jgi:hypothetical protein
MFIAIVQIPGAMPTVTYYDNHVVVDNETGKVHVDDQNT